MDKTPIQSKISDVALEAYYLLRQRQIVKITEPIRRNQGEGAPGWVFECVAKVPYPNQEEIPCEVPLRILIPEAFPREPVGIVPLSEQVSGFPHQDAESRQLCLREEYLAPRDIQRLVCYVKWAIGWLEDAANGMLLKPGDPYELPDFSRKLLESRLPTKFPLIFEESSNSYKKWESHIGKSGQVECFCGFGIPAIFVVKFCHKDGSLIRESGFAPNILKKNSKIDGKWVLVSDIRYERHRPPQTYKEMEELCSRNDLDFYTILKEAWNAKHSHQFGILFVGFPIPKIVGESPTEIHWQPLLFKNLKQNLKDLQNQGAKRGSKRESRKPDKIWQRLRQNGCFSPSQQLPWGRVENVTRERLYIRGAYPSTVQSTSMAFFGCGALGSSVAELLARGGVNPLNLFDPDLITFGNLCRHTLDGSSVNVNKAKALAARLSRANPLSTIKGYVVGVPLNSRSGQAVHQVLENADVLVDCTTSEAAFDWLDQYAAQNDKRLISLFFNFHAELLTVCISGDSTSCGDIFTDLKCSVQQNSTSLDLDGYFDHPSKEEEIIEGAGCWHPSFPALNAHVQILAAHAVDIISHSINSTPKRGLAAIVKRRSVAQNGVQPGPLVEVVWTKEYP
jgi:molybdopterin/thiamine biosynthesis adenylyltransferase